MRCDATTFAGYFGPLRKIEWVVYAKRPFARPAAVPAYLSRYTHRVAIANSRRVALDDKGVTFTWKDYRAPKANGGRHRQKILTLATPEFVRRFLLHVPPGGFLRIRHYGLFANGGRVENLARARQLLAVPHQQGEPDHGDTINDDDMHTLPHLCPYSGGRMIIIETFERGCTPRAPPTPPRPGNSS